MHSGGAGQNLWKDGHPQGDFEGNNFTSQLLAEVYRLLHVIVLRTRTSLYTTPNRRPR